jgi:hypothetical protein
MARLEIEVLVLRWWRSSFFQPHAWRNTFGSQRAARNSADCAREKLKSGPVFPILAFLLRLPTLIVFFRATFRSGFNFIAGDVGDNRFIADRTSRRAVREMKDGDFSHTLGSQSWLPPALRRRWPSTKIRARPERAA